MKTLRAVVLLAAACLLAGPIANAQLPPACADQNPVGGFTPINSPDGFIYNGLLLTDGRVMVQYVGGGTGNAFQDWWALTPDNTGSYVNGSWAQLASLLNVWPQQYGPFAFASAVLADGRVIVEGGEENPANPSLSDTNLGAIYDPTSGWSQLNPPGYPNSPWPHIGDAQSVVLQDGSFMIAACGSLLTCGEDHQQAILNVNNLTWNVLTSSNKLDRNSEEGYTLLPGGDVLTVDINNGGQKTYEVFNHQTLTWSNGTMPEQLFGAWPNAGEIGPAILLTDGTVFATGALPSHLANNPPANTDIFYANRTWQNPGLAFPTINPISGSGAGDESSVLLADGNVLVAAHDALNDYYFLEYQPVPQSWCSLGNVPTALQTGYTSVYRMLLLPTGQVLILAYDSQHKTSPGNYIYTPVAGPNSSWRPTISVVSGSLNRGTTYTIYGTQFNGLSQAVMFGDDYQAATNYPLVRITNNSSHHVFYAKTHNHSSMAVATGNAPTYTKFDVPSGMETGASTLVVVANGIASTAVNVTIN